MHIVSQEEAFSKKYLPKNTVSSTKWAMAVLIHSVATGQKLAIYWWSREASVPTVKLQLYACERNLCYFGKSGVSTNLWFLFMHFCLLSICSCISILRSISSHGSSLFSRKQCVSFTHFPAVVLVPHVERLFADCITMSPSLVSLAIGKEAVN